MDINIELWKQFSDIYFEELGHKYTDSLGTKYTSVTTFVGQFEPDKDWDLIAEKAIKNNKDGKYTGMSVPEVRAQWKYSGDYACTLGTAVHAKLENLWYKKAFHPDSSIFEKFPEMKEDYDWREQKATELFNMLKKTYVPVRNEFIVYDRDWKLVGTIDMLAYNTVKQCYSILDWKTSKKFDKTNRYQKMKAPFETEDDCNCNHYSMQLSVYQAILEKHCPDIKIGERVLVQIPSKETEKAEIYNCKDYTKKILDYFGEGKNVK